MVRPLRIVFAGHVDHGKSTMIGRLLHETGSLPDGKAAELEAISRKRGVPLEWSFVLDALQAERDQAITIDTTRVWFRWNDRRYAIIDAPGHRELVKNMLGGAAEADAAVLVVDAVEGISEQTRRHARLIGLLGIEQVVVAVNKLDAVGFDREIFAGLESEARALLESAGIAVAKAIPVSARDGDNLVAASPRTPWYAGSTLIGALEALESKGDDTDGPLRMRVQDVYRSGDARIAVGRIDSGTVKVGDAIVATPLGSAACVRSIERWNLPASGTARAGESIGLTFDLPIFIDRGDVIGHTDDAPISASRFRAVCFWLDARPPVVGESFRVQCGPSVARVTLRAIHDAVDSSSLAPLSADAVEQYATVSLELETRTPIPLDGRAHGMRPSRIVVLRGSEVVAGGVVDTIDSSVTLFATAHLVTRPERETRNGHRGAVIWLTGLSGSGKSTLAMALERRLFDTGSTVFVLDGDNVRGGLNRDLDFSPVDRAENIRRVAEVAALLAESGAIAITAFISPMASDRAIARQAAGAGFHLIHILADLATCEARDPKGLYKRARSGEIESFTGISAPYEGPTDADLVVDTSHAGIDVSTEQLLAYVIGVTRL